MNVEYRIEGFSRDRVVSTLAPRAGYTQLRQWIPNSFLSYIHTHIYTPSQCPFARLSSLYRSAVWLGINPSSTGKRGARARRSVKRSARHRRAAAAFRRRWLLTCEIYIPYSITFFSASSETCSGTRYSRLNINNARADCLS